MKSKILITLGIVLFSFCKKSTNNNNYTNAEITGIDYTMCACCGGTLITLINEQTEKQYLIINNDNLVASYINGPFPVLVKVKYETITPTCGTPKIKILAIEPR